MKLTNTFLMMAGALALAACTNPMGRGAQNGAGAGFGGNSGADFMGSVDDPTSPAHFQQAIGDRVLFAVDQSTLSTSGRATLDAQADWLIQNPAYTAIIEGHADEQGTREYNIALGARRASAAHAYLVERGVAASRLRTVSFGKERPVEICSNESCYSANRRAVTVLAAGVTG